MVFDQIGRHIMPSLDVHTYLVNKAKLHYVIDVDVESFFDRVNHSLLLSQLYTIGIKDKRVLTIISKMLKAPIEGEGIPTRGTPQGGYYHHYYQT